MTRQGLTGLGIGKNARILAAVALATMCAGQARAQTPSLSISRLDAGALGEIVLENAPPQHDQLYVVIALHPQLLELPTPFTLADVTTAQNFFRVWTRLASPEWKFLVPSFAVGTTMYFRAATFDRGGLNGAASSIVERTIGGPQGPPAGGLTLSEGVRLRVRDRAGVGRREEAVVTGLPLTRSEAITRPERQLKVVDDHGNQINAQYKVAARYGDLNDVQAPAKWVHVEFPVQLAANQSRDYFVTRRDTRTYDAPNMQVTETSSLISIDTGTALFQISKTGGSLFHSVFLDANLDGELTLDEEIIRPSGRSAAVLTDTLGNVYESRFDAPEVTIEEIGPIRTRIRVDGHHRAAQASTGIGRDYLRYTTWYDFYAGKSEVKLVHSLRNDYLENALGNIAFSDYRLKLDLELPGTNSFVMPSDDNGGLIRDNLPSSGYVWLYQEGNGDPNSFRRHNPNLNMSGWELARRSGGSRTVLASGQRAPGATTLQNARMGVTCSVRHFWQNYQKALGVRGPNDLEIALWPEDAPGEHWIADYMQKTHELTLSFFATAWGERTAQIQLAQAEPVRPWAGADYYRHTRTWGDSGYLVEPFEAPSEFARIATRHEQDQIAGMSSQDNLGWLAFGGAWSSQWSGTTGSPRNKLMRFDKWAITGEEGFFWPDEIAALHSSDVRRFQFEGFVASEHPGALLWTGGPYYNLSAHPDNLGRSNIPAAYEIYRTGIPADRSSHDWNGYDYEHFTADDIYQYYLLSNHPLMRRSLHRIGQGLLTFREVREPGFAPLATRGFAWTLRGLCQVYEVTGESTIRDGIAFYLRNWEGSRGRGPAGNAHVTRQPPHPNAVGTPPSGATQQQADRYWWDAPWQIAIMLHALDRYGRQFDDPRVQTWITNTADYLVDQCWKEQQQDFTKFLSIEDPTFYNGFDPYGLSSWIPGGLAVAYRYNPRPKYLQCADVVFDRWTYGSHTIALDHGYWHWWADYVALQKELGNLR